MKKIFTSVPMYCAIILFWIAAIALYAYSPLLVKPLREQKTLNIFAWPLMFDVRYLENFERETGIALNISYYESGEELYAKMQATGGTGYDLIVPSDNVIPLLAHNNLIKPLDHSKLNFLDTLDPRAFSHYFDPQDAYSIPYFMSTIGLCIDTDRVKLEDAPSWRLLFQPHDDMRVCMSNNVREPIMLAAYYLYHDVASLRNRTARERVQQLLIDQKKWVELYTDTRVDYLMAARSCPIVMAMQVDALRVKQHHSYVDFVLPIEGTFIVMDNLAIPAATTKDDMIYEFINYLYRSEVVAHHTEAFGSFIPTKQAGLFDLSVPYHFFKPVISEHLLNDMWIAVMAA